MRRARADEDFGGRAPDHDQAIAFLLGFELLDVLPQRLGQLALAAAGLDVPALQPLHIVLVEHGWHRFDALQKRRDRLEMLVTVKNAGADGGGIGIVRDRVPGAENQILEGRQLDEIPNQRRTFFSALAEPDGTHLGDRTNRPGCSTANILHAGDERRGYRTEPHTQHSKLPLSRRDLPGVLFRHCYGPFARESSEACCTSAVCFTSTACLTSSRPRASST